MSSAILTEMASSLIQQDLTGSLSDHNMEFSVGTGRSGSCPPEQTSMSTFAFLAFLLISIDTAMNILNNLNNNNNNNNNNDRNNNNNNMFNTMNKNERRSFQNNWFSEKMKNFTESGVTETWFDPVWTTRQKIIDGENAWSKDIFKSLRYRDGKKVGATEVMSKWMTAVLSSNPGCGASLFTCQHSYFRLPNDYCTSFKESCPLLF